MNCWAYLKGEMMNLVRIWIDDRRNTDNVLTVRADFDNDWHYEARIAKPYDQKAVADALLEMAATIAMHRE